MSIRIVIDNEDAGSPGVGRRKWTANVYDTTRPDDDGSVVAFGASPRDALNNLESEYALRFQMGRS